MGAHSLPTTRTTAIPESVSATLRVMPVERNLLEQYRGDVGELRNFQILPHCLVTVCVRGNLHKGCLITQSTSVSSELC